MSKPDQDNGDVSTYAVGQTVVGRVVSLEHYGAYVELRAGIVGLVLIPEISWSRTRPPGDVLRLGNEVRAVILVVNGPKRQISLSIKRLFPEPAGDGQGTCPTRPTSSPAGG